MNAPWPDSRPRGRKGGRKFALSKAQGAARAGRDGTPRHLSVRALQRTRDQARDALQVPSGCRESCASRSRRSSPLEPGEIPSDLTTGTAHVLNLSVGFRPLPQTTRVIAAMQAPDPSAQRESERRPHSVDGRRDPTPGSGHRAPVGSAPTAAARGLGPPQPEPATCASAGVPRGRPGENLEKTVPVMNNTGVLDHGGTTGLDGVSATTATSSSTRHTSRWSNRAAPATAT